MSTGGGFSRANLTGSANGSSSRKLRIAVTAPLVSVTTSRGLTSPRPARERGTSASGVVEPIRSGMKLANKLSVGVGSAHGKGERVRIAVCERPDVGSTVVAGVWGCPGGVHWRSRKLLRRRRWRQSRVAVPMRSMTTSPPSTPPRIAGVLELEEGVALTNTTQRFVDMVSVIVAQTLTLRMRTPVQGRPLHSAHSVQR